MGQTNTQMIKKCKQDSRTLSLQETDKAVGVESNGCSTFLMSIGLLVQGEENNRKSDSRNALVTFRDPATGKLKGESFFIQCCAHISLFYFCIWSNTIGRAITTNKFNVHSVICFVYEKKQYLCVSGDGDLFEVFDVLTLKKDEFLSKHNVFCVVIVFCQSLVIFL